MNPAERQPLLWRLAVLLPSLVETEPVARALVLQVRRLVSDSLQHLAQACAAELPAAEAGMLQAALRGLPEPDLLLPLLGAAITPAVLLRLELPDRASPAEATLSEASLAEAMLLHPDLSVREQTLDALTGCSRGSEPLAAACQAWAGRTLASVLSRLSSVSHATRLALQERVLGDARERPGDAPPSPGPAVSLRQALLQADDRACCLILSERAGVAMGLTEAAAAQRDARTLLSLCGKAGCTPEETLAVQVQLGRIRPDRALPPVPEADAVAGC